MNTPSGRQPFLRDVLSQFQRFVALETSGGIVLVACTVIALAWANSPWQDTYSQFWHVEIEVAVGSHVLVKTLAEWVTDGLMVVFFFVVGLEIKRELLIGELSTPRQALLPIIAAFGGMIVPALLYEAFNFGLESERGWGIPMATDIAFAVGVLTLLGSRVPLGLKIFLLALAIVDDLGAVLVIAIFYTSEISWISLAAGGGVLAILMTLNTLKVRHPIPYMVLGVVLWLFFLESGVHATVAGVLLAVTIPASPSINPQYLVKRGRELLAELEHVTNDTVDVLTAEQQSIVQELEDGCDRVESPLQSLEHGLHPWVTYVIMPIFALANAGVTISAETVSFVHPVGMGVIVGLVLGKLIGVSLFSWLSVRLKLATLPQGTSFLHIIGAGSLAGIGFTMSLFVAHLAFQGGLTLNTAKASILVASTISGIIGFLSLAWIARVTKARRLAEKA